MGSLLLPWLSDKLVTPTTSNQASVVSTTGISSATKTDATTWSTSTPLTQRLDALRSLHGLPPLDSSVFASSARDVLTTLANGQGLSGLVRRKLLSSTPPTVDANGPHRVVFYIREAKVNTVKLQTFLLDRFGESHPAHGASTTLVRYAGMTIDGSAIQRAMDDGKSAPLASRLTAFLDEFKDSLTWSAFEIPSLAIGIPRSAQSAQQDRDILARRYNVFIANTESALILALASGSLVNSAVGTLNSAVHGGLDLGQRIRSDALSALRGRLHVYLGGLPPLDSTTGPTVGTPASRFQAAKAHFVAAKDRLLSLAPQAGHLGDHRLRGEARRDVWNRQGIGCAQRQEAQDDFATRPAALGYPRGT